MILKTKRNEAEKEDENNDDHCGLRKRARNDALFQYIVKEMYLIALAITINVFNFNLLK